MCKFDEKRDEEKQTDIQRGRSGGGERVRKRERERWGGRDRGGSERVR